MRLVNLQPSLRRDLDWTRPLVLERVPLLLGRVPEPSVVNGRDIEVLSDPLDPGRETVDGRPVRFGERDLSSCEQLDLDLDGDVCVALSWNDK